MNILGQLPAKKPKLTFAGRHWLWVLLFLAFAFVVLIGPWPIDWSHYKDSAYAQMTFARVERLPLDVQEGTVEAAVAVREITPPVGEPMAGYSGRAPKESTGIKDKLFAKSLTLKVGSKCISIVSADILLFLPQIRNEIIRKTNLKEDEIYFTSTHTHSGPGGYAKGLIEEIVLGTFSEQILDRMSQQVSDVILASRKAPQNAKICTGVLRSNPSWVAITRNRSDAKSKGYEEVDFVRVLQGDKSLATLIIASPHATCLDKNNHQICGDYPTYLQAQMEKEFGGVCMFAAGAVGTMGPAHVADNQDENAKSLANLICARFRPVFTGNDSSCKSKISLGSWIVLVDIPSAQYRVRFVDAVGLSPISSSHLHSSQSFIHALRIDDLVLLGTPSDFSGELAQQLSDRAQKKEELKPVITSFNGDYIGYLITRKRFDEQTFESREENFTGPWGGEYFYDVLTRLLDRLSQNSDAT